MNRPTRRFVLLTAALSVLALAGVAELRADDPPTRPNFIFIMSDDHAAHAMSCYDSKINRTPQLDRLAKGGMRFTNMFCTNSICAPSRACILTGMYNHRNGVTRNGKTLDPACTTFPQLLQGGGYQTAMIGKWHLRSDPVGFDYWNILPGQGQYHNPDMIEMGERKHHEGYATDLITDEAIGWLAKRDPKKPFLLMCQHKAPHRNWQPDEKHAHMYDDRDIPEPKTFDDDYDTRCEAAREQAMSIEFDISDNDTKGPPPEGLTGEALKKWKYQRYIKDYLRCVASLDDNIGRLLDYLDKEGLADNTIVVYTSDQGFFLGDHGWYDKRFMYEESLRMPLLVRYPRSIKPGSTTDAIALNIDIAPTFLDYAGVKPPEGVQGASLRGVLDGKTPNDWRKSMYYHYYEYGHLGDGGWHRVRPHTGVRTDRYKLIHFKDETIDCWELYDLKTDPDEVHNLYEDPAYADKVKELKQELVRLQKQYGDTAEAQ